MKCVICKKECGDIKKNKQFPFCSNHCRNLDLYGWLSGEYTYKDIEPAPLVIDDDKGEN